MSLRMMAEEHNVSKDIDTIRTVGAKPLWIMHSQFWMTARVLVVLIMCSRPIKYLVFGQPENTLLHI